MCRRVGWLVAASYAEATKLCPYFHYWPVAAVHFILPHLLYSVPMWVESSKKLSFFVFVYVLFFKVVKILCSSRLFFNTAKLTINQKPQRPLEWDSLGSSLLAS